MDLKTGLKIAALVIVLVAALVFSVTILEHNDANEIMVAQSLQGNLTVYADPGVKFVWFSTTTKYLKRSQYSFSAKKNQGDAKDESIHIQFNDSGNAQISGVISWEMPTATAQVIKIHSLYGSQHAVEQQLVRPAIERAIYLTGPLMSSAEAYSARKPDLLRFFEDQAKNGVYQMETVNEKQPDPITGQEKTVQVVRIALDDKNQFKRQSTSQISEFGIILLSPAIDNIEFEQKVKEQIAQQQANFMQIQTAKAEALKAEQAALTAQKNGEAEAAKAKWTQEVIRATEVTKAEQERDVAKLGVETAELGKRKAILEGEGEAAKRRAIMQADGALEKKLATYEKVNQYYADAIKNHPGSWVPSVVMGGSSAGGYNGGSSQQLVEMLTAKTAMDLGLNARPSGKQ